VPKNWLQTALALIGVGIALLFTFIMGLYGYMTATATPLHPNPEAVPSVQRSAPSLQWAGGAKQGRQIVRSGLSAQNLPGLSVAVGIADDIVWAEGFGFADLEKRLGVTPDTRFRIGQTSIALTSAAVGLLLEKQRLNLDNDIRVYVPEFPQKRWPVTLRQIMGHIAGLRNDAGDEEPLSQRCERAIEGLPRFANAPLLFEPGTGYHRSTYGWILVSAAVEAVVDEPFFTFMRRKLFEPLGMDATSPDSATESIPNRATFYFPRFAGNNHYGPELARDGDYSCFAGAGGFLSTPSDLVRFGLAVSRGRLLQPATVAALQTPQRLPSGEDTAYGLGWHVETIALAGEPTRMAGHGTNRVFIGGTTSLLTFPERGIVVAVTANISFADTSSIAVKIAQVFAEAARGPARKVTRLDFDAVHAHRGRSAGTASLRKIESTSSTDIRIFPLPHQSSSPNRPPPTNCAVASIGIAPSSCP
jgi:serine beta-lactamase-like protein LACTB, mitochondrial